MPAAPMCRPVIRAVLLLALATAPFNATLGRDLNVLPQGRYGCWTPGSAAGPAMAGDPERSFTIVRGSSYTSGAGRGTYLLAGDLLTFTRGPFKDTRLRRNRDGFWQEIARDGELGRRKCHRLGAAVPN